MIDFLADHEDPASQSSLQPEHQVSKPASMMLDQPETDMIQFLRTLVPGSPEWKDVCAKISIKALLHWIAANFSFEVWGKSQFRVCVSRLVPLFWNRNQIFWG